MYASLKSSDSEFLRNYHYCSQGRPQDLEGGGQDFFFRFVNLNNIDMLLLRISYKYGVFLE